MLPIVGALLSSGLNILGNAVLAKGQDAIEKELGISLKSPKTEEEVAVLKELEFKHQEFLLSLGIKEKELEIEAEKTAQGNVTERWKSDMNSDSWLSKNVRPVVLLYWTVAITFLILLDSIFTGFKVKEPWISLIETSYMTILAAYFVGRTVQHVQNMRTKTNKEPSSETR